MYGDCFHRRWQQALSCLSARKVFSALFRSAALDQFYLTVAERKEVITFSLVTRNEDR